MASFKKCGHDVSVNPSAHLNLIVTMIKSSQTNIRGDFFMARNSNPEYWEQILAEQMNSGLTQTKWCEENDVSIHNFRYWKNRLKQKVHPGDKSLSSTWTLLTAKAPNTAFTDTENKTGEIIVQVGEIKMTLQNSVDLNFLSDVLKVLMQYV